MQIIPIRLFYSKKGRLKYISHLDTMNVFAKAIARAKLPVWYTEGFNPHIYMTIAMPLSLGYEGRREPLDIRLTEPVDYKEILQRLNAVLPEDMSIVKVVEPIKQPDEVAWAEYIIKLIYNKPAAEVEQAFAKFYSSDSIVIEKKTKRKTTEINLKEFIKDIKFAVKDDALEIEATIATGNTNNVNPRLLVEAFDKYLGEKPEYTLIVRKLILDKNYNEFE